MLIKLNNTSVGAQRSGGWEGRRPVGQRERRQQQEARRHTEPNGSRAVPGIQGAVNGCLFTGDRSWRNRGQEHQEEREWDTEGVRHRGPEGGKRQNWGWGRLRSHTEAIEKRRQSEWCVRGQVPSEALRWGRRGPNRKEDRGTQRDRGGQRESGERRPKSEQARFLWPLSPHSRG